MTRFVLLVGVLLGGLFQHPVAAQDGAVDDELEMDPRAIVTAAMNHWRGQTSYTQMTMTVRRPDWARSMSLQMWSRGTTHSLVRVTAPKKDTGTGTLLTDKNMWTYSPKVNRVIKIPSSMMTQSWMGSDFSNKDVSRSDDIIDQYLHTLDSVETTVDGHRIYTITSVPREEAAVVWGKEVLRVREDFVLVEQQFWDQDGVLVKSMKTQDIREMGGRAVARVMRMGKADKPDEWTEIVVDSVSFDVNLADNTFSLANLRNPRR